MILRELAPNGGFLIAGVAHVNHHLRSTADRDEAFCRTLAARLNLPITVDNVDVGDYAARERLSVEEAGRRARYAFLHRCAADVGADRIAVGQTRDDQAETFLLKLIRGAGLTGLGAIYPHKGLLVRPLIDVSRADLREYLTTRRESWVEDETNADLANPRNRIRHRVIPELEASYRGQVSASIARAASLAREDGTWLDALAARRYGELVTRNPEGVTLPAADVAAEPEPIRRRILLEALREVSNMREVALEHVETATDILTETSAGADLPAARLELRRGKLVLVRKR